MSMNGLCQALPVKIVGSAVVKKVEILFFTIKQLEWAQTMVRGKDNRGRTKGIPGMTKDVMKVARALLAVPFSKLGQRKTSKLLVPYICLGSMTPE